MAPKITEHNALTLSSKVIQKKPIQKTARKQRREECSKEVEEMAHTSKHPSFAKLMKRSHVSSCHWLNVPKDFCDDHLPLTVPDGAKNLYVILIDNVGMEYKIVYLPDRTGLSGGWREFSNAHSLVEGDELIFELIDVCKFKVSIMRLGWGSRDSQEMLDSQPKQILAKQPKHFAMKDQISYRAVKSKEVMVAFEDFRIVVDDVEFDSDIPSDIRRKYYDLCTMHREYLHCYLSIGDKLNYKAIVSMIIQTVQIADAIQEASVETPLEDLEKWSKTLGGFEDYDMSVGFLRVRISNYFHQHSRKTQMYQIKSKEKAKLEEQMNEIQNRKEVKEFKALKAKAEIVCQELASIAAL